MTGPQDTAGYVGVGWDRMMSYAFIVFLLATAYYLWPTDGFSLSGDCCGCGVYRLDHPCCSCSGPNSERCHIEGHFNMSHPACAGPEPPVRSAPVGNAWLAGLCIIALVVFFIMWGMC